MWWNRKKNHLRILSKMFWWGSARVLSECCYHLEWKKKKINFISKGDDYQIIFTSPKSKRNYIQKFFKKMNQKVTLIGNLTKDAKNNEIIDGDKRSKHAYNEGYSHNF